MKDLALHILDILQNSVTAGATLIQLRIDENPAEDKYLVKFIDNGKGMDAEMIHSTPGKGTEVEAKFGFSHIDRLPTGDIAGTLALTASSYPAVNFIYTHNTQLGTFKFDTAEIREELGEIPLSNPQVIAFMKELIRDNLKEIKAS